MAQILLQVFQKVEEALEKVDEVFAHMQRQIKNFRRHIFFSRRQIFILRRRIYSWQKNTLVAPPVQQFLTEPQMVMLLLQMCKQLRLFYLSMVITLLIIIITSTKGKIIQFYKF